MDRNNRKFSIPGRIGRYVREDARKPLREHALGTCYGWGEVYPSSGGLSKRSVQYFHLRISRNRVRPVCLDNREWIRIEWKRNTVKNIDGIYGSNTEKKNCIKESAHEKDIAGDGFTVAYLPVVVMSRG